MKGLDKKFYLLSAFYCLALGVNTGFCLAGYSLLKSNVGGMCYTTAQSGEIKVWHRFSYSAPVGLAEGGEYKLSGSPLKMLGISPGVKSYSPSSARPVNHLNPGFRIDFDTPIDSSSVRQGITLTGIKNNLYENIGDTLPISIELSTDSLSVFVTLKSSLSYNYTYDLAFSTDILDVNAEPMLMKTSIFYTSIASPSLRNIFPAVLREDIKAEVAVNSYEELFYMKISTDLFGSPYLTNKEDIRNAGIKTLQNESGTSILGYLDMQVLNSSHTAVTDIPGKSVSLTIPYLAFGVSDLSSPDFAGYDLGLFVFNGEKVRWDKLPSVEIDRTSGKMTTRLPFLAPLAVMKSPTYNLSQAYAYPVPYMPNSDARHNSGIIFNKLTASCRIRVFTVSGELVMDYEKRDDLPSYEWNCRTRTGEGIASGVYLYLITTATEKKSGKLIVIK